MFRTTDVTQCTLELESIENELQELVERMRLGSTTRPREHVPSTPPPGYSITSKTQAQIHFEERKRKLTFR